LCAPGDPEALAGAIEELLLNPERARALGEAGRRSVGEKFSAEAMARATLEIYRDAVAKNPQPATLNLQPN
jgi:glycosyltransferase involved in cell wall biosynthesis